MLDLFDWFNSICPLPKAFINDKRVNVTRAGVHVHKILKLMPVHKQLLSISALSSYTEEFCTCLGRFKGPSSYVN